MDAVLCWDNTLNKASHSIHLEKHSRGLGYTYHTDTVLWDRAAVFAAVPLKLFPKRKIKTTVSKHVLALATACVADDDADAHSDLPPSYVLLLAVRSSNRSTAKPSGLRAILLKPDRFEPCLALIHSCLLTSPPSKPILLILNPFGGTRKAEALFTHLIQPMLRLARCPFVLFKTSHRNHACQIVKSARLQDHSAVVSISGDGILHEIINGLMPNPPDIPIGTIPSGSANAMARNLDVPSVELATCNIIKLGTRPMDIFSVCQEGDTEKTYSHLQVMWTLLADVDFESERLRCLGNHRMTLAALYRLLRLRHYSGSLSFLPHDRPDLPENWVHLPSPSTFAYFCATNLPFISSTFCAAPDATLADRCFSLSYAHSLSPLQALRCLTDQESGSYLTLDLITTVKVSKFVLDPDGPKGRWIDVSGERYPSKKTTVQMERQLNIIAPDWLDDNMAPRHPEETKP